MPEAKTTATEQAQTKPDLQSKETAYVEKYQQKWEGLKDRYDAVETSNAYFQTEVMAYACPPDSQEATRLQSIEAKMENQKFSPEMKWLVQNSAQYEIDRLFQNKEKGRNNAEKHKIVTEQTKRYLDLISQAQLEGDVSQELAADKILHLVRENIYVLAYQDRVASENMLGDHGIRHLVDHNIKVVEKSLSELQDKGQQVRAVDRLIGHQIMIDHDTGYAMKPVRDQVNAGNFAADRGHNVLAAKSLRERTANQADALSAVFGTNGVDRIHQGILTHDSSQIEFTIDPSTNQPSNDEAELQRRQEIRSKNVESAIHLADNTHAFESKLPELLYGFPDSLRTMRLLKIAGEIGDKELVGQLKQDLVNQIDKNEAFAKDDKDALKQAAQSLSADSYKFSVGRICGNNPEVQIDAAGKTNVIVQESAIHQEAVGLYGQKEYDQLAKFVADLTGLTKDEIKQQMKEGKTNFGNDKIQIEARIGAIQKATEKTDYQQKVENLIKDPKLVDLLLQDDKDSTSQKGLEELLKTASEAERAGLIAQIEGFKHKRKEIVINYIKD